MSSGVVAKRYARALYETASASAELDRVEQELHALDQIFVEHPQFLQLLHHPKVDKKVKKEEFRIIFEGKLSQTMLSFMNLLIDRNREDELDLITDFYVRQANQERGIADAQVTSINPLTDAEKENLSDHFKRLIGKDIRIENIVDPEILGGIIVKIGDRLYDGSVQGKLLRFKRRVQTSKS